MSLRRPSRPAPTSTTPAGATISPASAAISMSTEYSGRPGSGLVDRLDLHTRIVFPVPVDIRCFNIVNAHCVGDSLGRIGGCRLRCDGHHRRHHPGPLLRPARPPSRGARPRHPLRACRRPELQLRPQRRRRAFGVYFDPTSNCRESTGLRSASPATCASPYVPWHPSLNRRFDRNVACGWAWGSSRTTAATGRRKIMATTHSTSTGRSAAINRSRPAAIRVADDDVPDPSRDPEPDPGDQPRLRPRFRNPADDGRRAQLDQRGRFGGARRCPAAYELQGEYQTPLIVNGGPGDSTITSRGDPPDVDVYIDDGGGANPYQPVHWHTTTIWNRRNPDGLAGHEEPLLGATNTST